MGLFMKWMITAFIVFHSPVSVTAGNHFNPTGALEIETRYTDPKQAPLGPVVVWQVKPDVSENRVSLDYVINGEVQFQVEYPFPMNDYPESAFLLMDQADRIIENSKGLLVPPTGFPAPALIYDVTEAKALNTLKSAITAGGRQFVKIYSCDVQTITIDEAIELEMLDPRFFSHQAAINALEPLVMIRINDPYKQLICEQLWVDRPASKWWLYEETPLTKSWRK